MTYIKHSLLISCLLFALLGCSSGKQLNPLASNDVILAFGDSLTFGTGVSSTQSYPAILSAKIHREVINAGIPGETSAQGLLRLPDLLAEHQPALVLLCFGGNDILRNLSLAQTKQNLAKMIEQIQSSGGQVVLIGVPKKSLFLSSLPLYQQLAEQYQIPLENKILATLLADRSKKSDSVHFNQIGYQALADALYVLLKDDGAVD